MRKKELIGAILITIIISGCSASTETVSNQTQLDSTSQQEVSTNEARAVALVSAGCSAGYLENLLIDGADSVMPIFWNGSISKFYVQENNIDIFDYEANEEDRGRNSIFQIDIWRSDFIEQSFVTAQTLDPKWNDLYVLWIDSMNYAVNDFRNGNTIGQSAGAAYDKYFPSFEPICKIAIMESKNAAQSQNINVLEWMNSVAGNLIPPQFEKFYN